MISTRDNHSNQCCFLCNSAKVNLFFAGGDSEQEDFEKAFLITDSDYHSFPDIYRCQACGLIFSDQYAETAAPLHYYRSMKDPEYHEEAQGRVIPFERILDRIEKIVPAGRLLDIGAATGIFLDAARRRGWQVSGVEPSTWAVAEARRKYDLEVIAGTLTETAFETGFFDVVVLLDVLEHVTQPLELLNEIKRILKPDGLVVLTTPNIGSPVARFLGRKWWHIRRAHQFYFTWSTIRMLLERAGFSVVRKKYYPWAFSLHYWISRFENFNKSLYRIFSRFEANKAGRKISRTIVKLNFFDSFELYLKPQQTPVTDDNE